MYDRGEVVIILGAGVSHLEDSFKTHGYEYVFTSGLNYDGKRKFPNSDIYTTLSAEELKTLQEKHVILVASANYMELENGEKWSTADFYFEMLQFLHLLNNPQQVEKIGHKKFKYEDLERSKQIDLVLTCMPCGKQDHAVKTGEAVSAQMVLESLQAYVDTIYIIDPHPPLEFSYMEQLVENDKLIKLSMVDMIRKKIYSKFSVPEPFEVTADEFGQKRMKMKGLGKVREDSNTVKAIGELDVEGKNIVFIDDMILTGGTLRSNVKKYQEMGANKVLVGIVHPLPLVKGNDARLKQTLNEVNQFIVTNTVYSSFLEIIDKKNQLVDCVPLIDSSLEKYNS